MQSTALIQTNGGRPSETDPQFRSFAESLPHLVWTCRADGPCDYLSPQWVKYTGIPAEAQLGYGWLEQLHPEDVAPVRMRWAAAIAADGPFETEFRIRRFDGVYRWFKTRAVPLTDETGRVARWVGTNTDIQDLKDAQDTAARLNGELEQRVAWGNDELRAANKRLETVAVQLQIAQRLTNVGSWEYDPHTGNTIWSEELFRTFARDPAEGPPNYRLQAKLFTPESWSRLEAAIAHTTATGESYELTLSAVRSDGETRTTVARGEALRGPAGEVEQIVGTFQDVTARERIARQLEQVSERLQLAASAANIGVWDWNLVSGSVVWDETMLRLYEMPPQRPEDIMDIWRQTVHPDDAGPLQARLEETLRSGREFEFTFRVTCPTGKLKHLRASALLERDATGRAVRMIGVNWDITEQRIAELALRQSEALQRALLAHAGPAIIAVHADGTIHLFNRAAEDLLGYSAEEVIGHANPVLIHDPVEIEARQLALQREFAVSPTSPFDVLVFRSRLQVADASEWTYVRKDGSRVPVLLTISALRDDAKAITGYLGVAVNLTQRKAQERELLELNRLLAERTGQMEVLLQEVHHRVKNNLQVIASLVGMQQRQVTDAATRGALAECKTRIQAIALIHQQLYQSSDYSRIPFSDYAQQLGHNVFAASGADRERIEVSFDMDAIALPVEKAIPCGLILNELLTNALKHAFPGGRRGTVTVALHATAGSELTLSVMDDGVGLPSGFAVAECRSLGLHLVSDLAAQLDGRLVIAGDNGTRASVILPFNPGGAPS